MPRCPQSQMKSWHFSRHNWLEIRPAMCRISWWFLLPDFLLLGKGRQRNFKPASKSFHGGLKISHLIVETYHTLSQWPSNGQPRCGDGISSSSSTTSFPLSEVFLLVTALFISEALIPIWCNLSNLKEKSSKNQDYEFFIKMNNVFHTRGEDSYL